MNGVGLFFLLLLLLVILPALAFVGFTRWQAHKRGLPAPPLSAYNPLKLFRSSGSSSGGGGGGGGGRGGSGPVGWVKGKLTALRDHRAGQGYAGATRGARGFGPLDPDAAWDDRVALEADAVDERGYARRGGPYADAGYEEQELGGMPPSHQQQHPQYPRAGASAMPAYGAERGRGRADSDGDDGVYHGASLGAHELDARYEETVHGRGGRGYEAPMRGLSPRPADDQSSQKDRRSIFREDV